MGLGKLIKKLDPVGSKLMKSDPLAKKLMGGGKRGAESAASPRQNAGYARVGKNEDGPERSVNKRGSLVTGGGAQMTAVKKKLTTGGINPKASLPRTGGIGQMSTLAGKSRKKVF